MGNRGINNENKIMKENGENNENNEISAKWHQYAK
jgi:hypothetical protein